MGLMHYLYPGFTPLVKPGNASPGAGGDMPMPDEAGQMRLFAVSKFDPAKAAAAAKRIAEIGAKSKPSKKYGASATIRKIRDGE